MHTHATRMLESPHMYLSGRCCTPCIIVLGLVDAAVMNPDFVTFVPERVRTRSGAVATGRTGRTAMVLKATARVSESSLVIQKTRRA